MMMNTLKLMPVTCAAMRAMPTTPPSMTWFGTRKTSRPMV